MTGPGEKTSGDISVESTGTQVIVAIVANCTRTEARMTADQAINLAATATLAAMRLVGDPDRTVDKFMAVFTKRMNEMLEQAGKAGGRA